MQSGSNFGCGTPEPLRPAAQDPYQRNFVPTNHPNYFKEYHFGEVHYIRRYQTTGSELDPKNGRPAVIVSRDEDIRRYNTVMVAFFSSSGHDEQPTQTPGKVGIVQGYVRCEMITTVDKSLIGDYVGVWPETCEGNLFWSIITAFGAKQFIDAYIANMRQGIMNNNHAPVVTKDLSSLSKIYPVEEMKARQGDHDLQAELDKLRTERDMYENLYNGLLDRMMGKATR